MLSECLTVYLISIDICGLDVMHPVLDIRLSLLLLHVAIHVVSTIVPPLFNDSAVYQAHIRPHVMIELFFRSWI